MLILQKPEGYCFEKNIPDIVLQKQNDETVVNVTLKLGETVILEENYKFDADGIITIRRIDEIVSAYLKALSTVVSGNIITAGLIKKFTIELNSDGEPEYELTAATKIASNGVGVFGIGVYLSEVVAVGDLLYDLGGIAQNITVTQIVDSTNILLFSNDILGYPSGIGTPVTAKFRSSRFVTLDFSVLRCEADMPAGLSAGTFAGQNFLTRLPREKQTATNRNEYLTYIHFGNYAEVVVKYKAVYLIDGVRTEASGSMLTVAADVDNEDRYITFNASLSVIRQLANLTTERILQYDIWFEEAEVSEVFTFLINDTYFRNKTCFVFENSFGVLETFTATGRTDTKKNIEINLANIQSRYRKTTQDFVAEKTINTGFLSAEEMDWLDDLILSYNVAIYIPGVSGADEEITLTSTDKTDTDENELQAFSFSYRRSRNNHLQFAAAARGIFDDTFDQTFN